MRSAYEQICDADPDHPVTIEVPERREVIRPDSIHWLTPEDATVHCVGCRNAYNQGYSNGNGWTRDEALAAMTAECHERYILSEMWRNSEGAGVWATPEGAVAAAQREYAERWALAELWREERPAPRVPSWAVDPNHAWAFSQAMGPHRRWHAVRLPSPFPVHAAMVVTYRRADTTGIVLGTAGGRTLRVAVSKAMLGTAMLYFGSKREGSKRRWQFMRWASKRTARFLWPSGRWQPPAPMALPAPTIFSRHGPYHFAMCPVPDSHRMMKQRGYGDALG